MSERDVTPEQVLAELSQPTGIDERPGLDRMRRLVRLLGDPQMGLPAILIGGTAGKGSTAMLLAAILQAAGLPTGLHTKPHLMSLTERFQIDGRAIEPGELIALLREAAPAAGVVRPTWHELTVAIALRCFARAGVTAVVEVGLGGEFDSTNVLDPAVAVVTNVGLDHTRVLGATVGEIAATKAGILKRGAIAITGALDPVALGVIEERCRAEGVELWRVGREIIWRVRAVTTEGSWFDLSMPHRSLEGVRLRLLGEHQVANAALAVAAAWAFELQGFGRGGGGGPPLPPIPAVAGTHPLPSVVSAPLPPIPAVAPLPSVVTAPAIAGIHPLPPVVTAPTPSPSSLSWRGAPLPPVVTAPAYQGREPTPERGYPLSEREPTAGSQATASSVGWPSGETSPLGTRAPQQAVSSAGREPGASGMSGWLSDDAIRRGLAMAALPGRLEVLGGQGYPHGHGHAPRAPGPLVLLDGAHSPPKMAALARAIRTLFPGRRVIGVLAANRGHDLRATLAEIAPLLSAAVVTRYDVETDFGRGTAFEPAAIAEALAAVPREVVQEMEPARALARGRALAAADRDEAIVLVTGSLYLVGQLRAPTPARPHVRG